jgi:alpha-glucosidase (family GH31 glycosyl hydrolase)
MYNRQNYGYTEGDPRINQMNITVPLFVSSRGYGVLFDDYAAASLVMSNPITYSTENRAPISYYFIYGKGTIEGVTKEYTALTGRQSLPPFWALGYITSKYGYRTQAETLGVIDTLKTQGYPVDGVVLDLYWYGQETDMGRLEWNKQQWPDHKQMLADLKKEGVNAVIISQPYINKIGALDNYNQLAANGLLTKDANGNINDVTTWVGEAGMFDVANPATRRWLSERYRTLTDEGVAGWWGDLGEPEVHPETIVHANGETAREYHNVYGNVWSSIIYDLFRNEYPNTRLMTLMRGGTAGLQRYSVFPWSTDVSRSWGGLQPQVKIMLNSGLSGLGYMSHDVGGFAVDSLNAKKPELYVRWLQLGTFSPILRTHAQLYAEPYQYPEYAPILLDLVKTRYRWLPYNYTLAYENATSGYPLVRPLNFESTAADSLLDNVTDQYLWGNEVMVAPVIQEGARSRSVVIPSGTWIDYNHPTVTYTGPKTITYDAPLDVLPLFVRNGAFIPQADYEMQNTGDYNPSLYTVLYYPRGEVSSSYTLFEDDRTSTNSISTGNYALINFKGVANNSTITITADVEGYYPGMPSERTITFTLPGISSAHVKGITVNGTPRPNPRILTPDYTFEVTLGSSPVTITIDLNN